MALFNNNYSLLITKGLGGPACCAILTASLGLAGCTCDIRVIPVPSPGTGGWAQFPVTDNGFYVPLTKKMAHGTKMVLVTVKFKDKSWRKSYIVSRVKGDVVITVLNFTNVLKNTLSVSVESIKRTTKRVTAIFDKEDK